MEGVSGAGALSSGLSCGIGNDGSDLIRLFFDEKEDDGSPLQLGGG